MRIVYWCLNSSLVNSWLLYRRDIALTDGKLKHMPLINFKLDVAIERGRPSSLILPTNTGTSPSPSTLPSSAPFSTSLNFFYEF